MSGPDVAVTLVTFESAGDLPRCLDALASQSAPPREVVVVDNGSGARSAEIAQGHPIVTRVERNADNRGFAAAQNQAIACTLAPWVLVLNPDVTLAPDFLAELRPYLQRDVPLGALCGKLLRAEGDGSPRVPATLDSTGIIFDRSFRHLDRGSETEDRGLYEEVEEVFGATGAAVCFRRAMIDDVGIEGEFFDEAFFAYREDADVAWRAQILGWDCLYVPRAIGWHVRRVLPTNRRSIAASLNRHSVRNRFLMRIKNADGPVWRRCGWRGILRDAAVIGGCLTIEWSSLPALLEVIRLAPRAWRQRKWIRARRRRTGEEVARWFV